MTKIYFYNTFHNGDVHYSRSFVKDVMNKLGDNEYWYLHNNNPKILKDISIKHDKAFTSFDNWNLISDYPIHYYNNVIKRDHIYINTWVGQQNYFKNGQSKQRQSLLFFIFSL